MIDRIIRLYLLWNSIAATDLFFISASDRITQPIDVKSCSDAHEGDCNIGAGPCNLRAAIDLCTQIAPPLCNVVLWLGVHSVTHGPINISTNATTTISISSAGSLSQSCLDLTGVDAMDRAVVDGSDSLVEGARLFHVRPGGVLTLAALEIAHFGGAGTEDGGAIYSQGVVRAKGVLFTGNTARRGAAVFTGNETVSPPLLLEKLRHRSRRGGGDGQGAGSGGFVGPGEWRGQDGQLQGQGREWAGSSGWLPWLVGQGRGGGGGGDDEDDGGGGGEEEGDDAGSGHQGHRPRGVEGDGGRLPKLVVDACTCDGGSGGGSGGGGGGGLEAGSGGDFYSLAAAVVYCSPSCSVDGALVVTTDTCQPSLSPSPAPSASFASGGGEDEGAGGGSDDDDDDGESLSLSSAFSLSSRRGLVDVAAALAALLLLLLGCSLVRRRRKGRRLGFGGGACCGAGGPTTTTSSSLPPPPPPAYAASATHTGSETTALDAHLLASLYRHFHVDALVPDLALDLDLADGGAVFKGGGGDNGHHHGGGVIVEGGEEAAQSSLLLGDTTRDEVAAGGGGGGGGGSAQAKSPWLAAALEALESGGHGGRGGRSIGPGLARPNKSSAGGSWLVDPAQLELGAMIGVGSSAHVFEAAYFGEPVAAKRLPLLGWKPGEVEAFLRHEAGLLVRLHHPSVITLFGVGVDGDYVTILTELCRGGSLTQLLRRANARPEAEPERRRAAEAGQRRREAQGAVDALLAEAMRQAEGRVRRRDLLEGSGRTAATGAAAHAKALAAARAALAAAREAEEAAASAAAAACALPPALLVSLALGVARGVAFLHSRGVVHRDLKPDNVLLTEQHEVKLCDFGISRLVHDGPGLTTAVGTPLLMAPELVFSTTARHMGDDDGGDDGVGGGVGGGEEQQKHERGEGGEEYGAAKRGVPAAAACGSESSPIAGADGGGGLGAHPSYVGGGGTGSRNGTGRGGPKTAVDVFSLGVLLWMMASQRLMPYLDVENPWHLLAQVAKGRRPPLAIRAAAAAEEEYSDTATTTAVAAAVKPLDQAAPRPPPPPPPQGPVDHAERSGAPPAAEVLGLAGTNLGRLPPRFRHLVAACWDGDPAARPSAANVARELEAIAAQIDAEAEGAS